ncbi:hypothetical protein CB0940_05125 [Cercospora beticola]|uniref:Uncharacterized protein n=1 Tax=Cercospora beticola TaxID=122368 RepID=A0A2G5HL43_CERBT|nr:hypothetical protein CB0940_05125 [Cercospora beticola]PIA93250.1 hypothetical protein CB0940_05125 [Cercospora beticola]WPB02429.1 hypothetical protein RHO25_007063 [Cercospora beticola]CAK1362680.1 unnamed protein product [Cercospora beticola]
MLGMRCDGIRRGEGYVKERLSDSFTWPLYFQADHQRCYHSDPQSLSTTTTTTLIIDDRASTRILFSTHSTQQSATVRSQPHQQAKMQFTILATTFLATLAAAAPVAVPKTTVVEREAGGALPFDSLLKGLPLNSLLGGGAAKDSNPATAQLSQLNQVGAQPATAPQGKTGSGLPGVGSIV